MEQLNLPKILTVEEIAVYLRTDETTVVDEMKRGLLKGFKVGDGWRTTEEYLLEYIKKDAISTNDFRKKYLDYVETDLTEIGSFEYKWPSGKESFDHGYETVRQIGGKKYNFRIGFTQRQAAGQNRRRIIVWMNNWPLVEFAGGNNFDSDSLLASIIKLPNGKQLRPSGKIPDEYKNFQVAEYDSIVQGPFASRNLAIIVREDDLESIIRHAIIRATTKGLL